MTFTSTRTTFRYSTAAPEKSRGRTFHGIQGLPAHVLPARVVPWGNLRALLRANPGYFRILVLVVTPERFYQDETTVTREEAQRWLAAGFKDLPAEMARLPVDDQVRVTGLIYEFLVPTVGEAADIAIPGRLTGPAHIQSSGILDHLRR
jgi:hypothetical protein